MDEYEPMLMLRGTPRQDRFNLGQPEELQKCCIDCIIANFERFMEAYRSNESIPPRYFEFLQRTHSKVIFERLLLDEPFFLRHIDFILNPFLKEIDLDQYTLTDTVPIVERLETIGNSIKFLSITGMAYSKNLLLRLTSALPNVETLSLVDTPVCAEVLENIGRHCHVLRTLNVAFCPGVTDIGLTVLCTRNENTNATANITLQCLDISQTTVSSEGIAFALRHFPNLTTIVHDGLYEAIHKMHIDDFLNNSLSDVKYNLKELAIQCPFLRHDTNSLKMCTMVCPHISKLNVSGITTQADIDVCTEFSELKEVYFSDLMPHPAFISISPFIEVRGQNLTLLDISEGYISAESLLKYCPKLQSLSLQNTAFESFKEFQNTNSAYALNDLKQLAIQGSNFGNPTEAKSVKLLLSSSSNLEKMHFLYTESFSFEFCRAIAQYNCMATLLDLDVSYSDIPAPGIREIMLAAPNLQNLGIQHCDVSYFEFEDLANINNHVKINWRDDSEEYSEYNGYDYENDGYFDYDYFDFDNGYDDYDEYYDGDMGFDDSDELF